MESNAYWSKGPLAGWRASRKLGNSHHGGFVCSNDGELGASAIRQVSTNFEGNTPRNATLQRSQLRVIEATLKFRVGLGRGYLLDFCRIAPAERFDNPLVGPGAKFDA